MTWEEHREKEGSGGGQGLVIPMKEYGLCPDSNLELQKDFKLEGGIIRFACQKMWKTEREAGQN